MSKLIKKSAMSEEELQDLVAEADTGARSPGGIPRKILLSVAAAWSLFHLWIASPLPFMVGFGVFNDTETRSIHLAFAVFLAFLGYPALKRSPRHYIPLQDWIMAAVGAFAPATCSCSITSCRSGPVRPTPRM